MLYITTLSSSPVTYTVRTYNGTLSSGTVTKKNLAKLNISSTLVVLDSSYQHRYKGIHVSASNEISVLSINYLSGSIGEYFAYSIASQDLNVHSVGQYQYYAVSTGQAVGSTRLSEVLLVGTEYNTTVTVVPTQNISVPQDFQVTNSPEINVAAGTTFSFIIHELQTILLGSINDLTGTSIVSNKPLTVISGHECGNVPDNVNACEHLTEQMPPTVNWGQQFLLTPYSDRPAQYYKVIAAENETTYNLTCGRNNTVTRVLQTSGKYHTDPTCSNCYCFISSDKPILVIQLGPGFEMGRNKGAPVISLIPSINQYSHEVVFVSLNIDGIASHYINIATTTNDSTILLDGNELSLTWNPIYDHTNDVIGYGTQLQSINLDVSHTLTSQSKFTILVYGFKPYAGYSYSAIGNSIKGTFIHNTGCNLLKIEMTKSGPLQGEPAKAYIANFFIRS